MALQNSGPISLSDVNVELGNSSNAQLNMGNTDLRNLFQDTSGAISMSSGYGKSNEWTPEEIISSVKIWYDADDSATITLNGSTVSQWSDKSGNNWHATNATSSSQPTYVASSINGKGTLTFFYDQLTASSAYLTGTGFQGFIVTYMENTSSPYARATSFNKSGNYNDFSNTFSWLPTFRNNNTNIISTMQNTSNPPEATISYGQTFLHTSVLPTGSGLYHRLNGGTIPGTGNTPSSLDTTRGLRIGNANNVNPEWYHGGIGEVIFTSGLSQADIENVEGYLAWKWGLGLAPGHPYALDGTKFGGGVRWTPAQMTTTMWLDAGDSSTLTLSGSQIGQWSDKSGNGHHAVQTNYSIAPYYVSSAKYSGAYVVEFKNTSAMNMNVPNLVLTNKNHQVFIVADMDNTSQNWARLLSFRQSGLSQDFSNTTSWTAIARNFNTSAFISGHNNQNTQAVAGSYGVPILLRATFGSTAVTLSANGAAPPNSVPSNNLNTTDGARIGQSLNTYSELFKGRIAEIIVCPEQSTANTQKIEGYLAHKWGTSGSLPTTHPYRYSPP